MRPLKLQVQMCSWWTLPPRQPTVTLVAGHLYVWSAFDVRVSVCAHKRAQLHRGLDTFVGSDDA